MQTGCEKAQSEPPQFKAQLENILTRELTVDGIPTYAEVVMKDLSSFSDSVTETYKAENPDEPTVGMALEDRAFKAYDLPLLSELLEEAHQQDSKIKQAGSFIASEVKLVETVITPPDEQNSFSATSANTYEQPELKNRLQTLLYFAQDLGVDLKDVSAKKGEIPPKSVRDESYVTVEIPDIKRVVYVCDEEENASYVFDSEAVAEAGLNVEQLDGMTKKEKNELIESQPVIGKRFLQGPHWVSRLRTLLTESFAERANIVSAEEDDPWKGFWFNPEDGKHYGNLTNLEGKLTIGRTILVRYIDENVAQARVRSGGVRWKEGDGYAYEDFLAIQDVQAILAVPLTERKGEWAGFYRDPDSGERIGTLLSLERKLGVHYGAIISAAERQGLLPVQLRSATRLSSDGYSYEGLLRDEKLQEFMNVPRVETDGDWKGFWTDSEGFHWGAIASIRTVLGVHAKMIEDLIEAGNFATIRTRGTNKITNSYRLEDFANQPKILELTTARIVDVEGEWQGIYTEPDTGNHYAPLRTISNRLGRNDDHVRDMMAGKEVETIPVRARNKRAVGGVYKAYCFEQIIS